MKQSGDTKELYVQLDEKTVLEDRLSSLTSEYYSVHTWREAAKRKLIEIKPHISSLENTVENDHSNGSRPSRYESALRIKKQEADKLNSELKDLDQKYSLLEQEMSDIKAELSSMKVGATTAQLIEHKKKLDAENITANNLREILSEKEAEIISAGENNSSRFCGLHERHEEILAEIALGDKSRKEEISELEEQINEASKYNAEQDSLKDRLKQTIRGLKRKLQQVEEQLDITKKKTPGIVEQFLKGEAENIGKAYLKNAADIKENFKKLVAIERLLVKTTGSDVPKIKNKGTSSMIIPAFNLTAFANADSHDIQQGIYFSEAKARKRANNSDEYEITLNCLIENYRNQGLDDFF